MTLVKGSAWIALSEFYEFVSLALAVPINLLLLYCILNKSPKEFGGYRNLMAWFTMQSIFFSFVACFTHMSFHTIDGTFMMFTISNHLNLPSWAIWCQLGLCCISVGYVLLILSAQFVYRYFAMVNPANLKYFTGFHRLYFALAMLLVAVVYGGCGFVGINLTPERDKHIRKSMAIFYDVAPERIHYVAVEYYETKDSGVLVINWMSIATATALNIVFGSMVFVIIYCGIKTYKRMQVKTYQLSNHMYIQKQLFTALIVQTLTPTVLIFIPCIIFYVLPIFAIPLCADANILSISLVLYPVIDPIGVLFIIKNYRAFLRSFFYRRLIRRSRCSVSLSDLPTRVSQETEQTFDDIPSNR